MKAFIILVMVIGGFLAVRGMVKGYRSYDAPKTQEQTAPAASGTDLPGLPAIYEASLATAQAQGHAALGAWLQRHRAYVRDPRLANIELDYVVLATSKNRVEARKIFEQVKVRTPASSPVYPRVKRLEKSF